MNFNALPNVVGSGGGKESPEKANKMRELEECKQFIAIRDKNAEGFGGRAGLDGMAQEAIRQKEAKIRVLEKELGLPSSIKE